MKNQPHKNFDEIFGAGPVGGTRPANELVPTFLCSRIADGVLVRCDEWTLTANPGIYERLNDEEVQ